MYVPIRDGPKAKHWYKIATLPTPLYLASPLGMTPFDLHQHLWR